MSWLRRLLQMSTAQRKINAEFRRARGLKAMPTVEFDSAILTESVKADLRRNIELLDDVEKRHVQRIYDVALGSILAGRDLHILVTALMRIDGITKERANEIARLLHNKATSLISRDHRASLGIIHAIWMYSNAPCMRNPKQPTAADVQRDAAHRAANGKKYEVARGLFVDGKWTQPGTEKGCKCSSRSVLPFPLLKE